MNGTVIWGYGFRRNESRWTGSEGTPEQALEEARLDAADRCHTGPVYIVQGLIPEGRLMFDAREASEHIIDQASSFAHDNFDTEWDDDFPSVTEKAQEELTEAIQNALDPWIEKHVTVNFWRETSVTKVLFGETWEDAQERQRAECTGTPSTQYVCDPGGYGVVEQAPKQCH